MHRTERDVVSHVIMAPPSVQGYADRVDWIANRGTVIHHVRVANIPGWDSPLAALNPTVRPRTGDGNPRGTTKGSPEDDLVVCVAEVVALLADQHRVAGAVRDFGHL